MSRERNRKRERKRKRERWVFFEGPIGPCPLCCIRHVLSFVYTSCPVLCMYQYRHDGVRGGCKADPKVGVVGGGGAMFLVAAACVSAV